MADGRNEVNITVKAKNQAKPGLSGAVKDSKASGERAGQAFSNAFSRAVKIHAAAGLGAAAIGGVGAAAGAAVPTLVAFGAAGAVVAAGMDGIKKAAEGAKPGIEQFKKAVSGVFEKKLSKDFDALGKTVGNLSEAGTEAAGGIAEMISQAMGVVTARKNFKKLEQVLFGVADMFGEEGMAPGLADFVQGLINAGAAGSKSMDTLGAAIGHVFSRLGETFSELAADGTIGKAVEGFSATIRGLGDVLGPVVALLTRMGAAVGDKLGVFLSKLGEGITAATPGFERLAAAGGRLLGELSPLLPVIGEMAGKIADELAAGIESALPTIQSLVGWLVENKDVLLDLTPAIIAAVVAFKGLQVASSVAGWLTPAGAALRAFGVDLDGIGRKADGAGGKVDGFGKKLGGLKGAAGAAGAAGAILAVGFAIDEMNIKAAGGADKLDGIAVNLHQFRDSISKIFTGDIGFGRMYDQAAAVIQGIKNQFAGFKLTPIRLEADGSPAQATVDQFLAEVNGATPQVNINGNVNGAGHALRQILAEIAAGHESVVIDGEPVPAQEALARVKSMIDTATGNVTIDGDPMAASRALTRVLGDVNRSTASVNVDAKTGAANAALNGFVNNWNGRRINIYVTTHGTGGIASAGRFAAGGPVKGPGTGTSDTAGLFALSNGEYVATARQVRNAGGPDGFGRLMAALDRGQARGFAGGGEAIPARPSARAAMRTPAPSAGPVVTFAGNTSDALATVIMQMIRTGKIQIA